MVNPEQLKQQMLEAVQNAPAELKTGEWLHHIESVGDNSIVPYISNIHTLLSVGGYNVRVGPDLMREKTSELESVFGEFAQNLSDYLACERLITKTANWDRYDFDCYGRFYEAQKEAQEMDSTKECIVIIVPNYVFNDPQDDPDLIISKLGKRIEHPLKHMVDFNRVVSHEGENVSMNRLVYVQMGHDHNSAPCFVLPEFYPDEYMKLATIIYYETKKQALEQLLCRSSDDAYKNLYIETPAETQAFIQMIQPGWQKDQRPLT